MLKQKKILVLSVDRDNDLEKKTGIKGPIIGRQQCLKAAAKLAIQDPTESDANCIFGAIKKYDEIKENTETEVAIITGTGKNNYESDQMIIQQLEEIMEKFPATGFLLVTDGAEDDQVIPILQGKAPIVSKETIIIKQANQVESTYYTLKQALNDPDFARTFVLVPGIIILFWGILTYIGQEKLFFTTLLTITGTYLILKGTGIENKIVNIIRTLTSAISLQRVSFPFYLLTIILFIFGIYATITEITKENKITQNTIIESTGQMLLFLALSSTAFIIGKVIDALQLKKAYTIKKYFMYGSAIIVLWIILDSARQVIANKPYADLTWFGLNSLASFLLAITAYKISQMIDIQKKITKLLIGLPIYTKDGELLGTIETIDTKNGIYYKNKTGKQTLIKTGNFYLSEGKVLVQ
ncbi:MAG: DUF373 family protein [Candidatus Diapherotrites archaeon]